MARSESVPYAPLFKPLAAVEGVAAEQDPTVDLLAAKPLDRPPGLRAHSEKTGNRRGLYGRSRVDDIDVNVVEVAWFSLPEVSYLEPVEQVPFREEGVPAVLLGIGVHVVDHAAEVELRIFTGGATGAFSSALASGAGGSAPGTGCAG